MECQKLAGNLLWNREGIWEDNIPPSCCPTIPLSCCPKVICSKLYNMCRYTHRIKIVRTMDHFGAFYGSGTWHRFFLKLCSLQGIHIQTLPPTSQTSLSQILNTLCCSDNETSSISLMLFVHICSLIKPKILVVYPSTYTGDSAPLFLPSNSNEFLSLSCGMPTDLTDQCWSLLKDDIWSGTFDFLHDIEPMFLTYGVEQGCKSLYTSLCLPSLIYGFAALSYSLYPPTSICINPGCLYVCQDKQVKLQGAVERNAILYTITRGPLAVQCTHITCNSKFFDSKYLYVTDFGFHKRN